MGKLKSSAPDAPKPDGPEPVWDPPDLATWLEQVQEDKAWLIEHLLPEDALVLVSGQQKRAFKTWFTFLVALCLATGKKVGLISPVRTGPVIIIEEEGTRAQTKERWLMLCKTNGIDPSTLTNVIFIHRNRVKLDDERWRLKLLGLVKRIEPVLVIYDALSYSHTGNENSHEDMSPVIDTLATLRAMGPSVMILAHLDKERGENRRADIDTQVRGSSIVVNAYDTHIALRRYKMHDKHIDCIVRARDDEERKYLLTWDIKEGERAKLTILGVLEGEGPPPDQLLQKCETILAADPDGVWSKKRLREIWEVSEKTASTIRDAMIKAGTLEERNGAYARTKSDLGRT